jgi:hypothetical protein
MVSHTAQPSTGRRSGPSATPRPSVPSPASKSGSGRILIADNHEPYGYGFSPRAPFSLRVIQLVVQAPVGSMNVWQTRRHRAHSSSTRETRRLILESLVKLDIRRKVTKVAQTSSESINSLQYIVGPRRLDRVKLSQSTGRQKAPTRNRLAVPPIDFMWFELHPLHSFDNKCLSPLKLNR